MIQLIHTWFDVSQTRVKPRLMIHQRRNDILALLADGSICMWDIKAQAINPQIMCTDTVSVLKVCTSPSIIAALTIDGRFLVGLRDAEGLEDRTAFIREILCHDDHDVIKGLYVFDHSILFNTETRICVMSEASIFSRAVDDISELKVSVYEIPSGINLISFNDGHGFLRTNDNKLHSMGRNTRWQLGVPYHDQVWDSNKPRLLGSRDSYKLHTAEFDDTENIQEIVCGYMVTLFLMKNGIVRAGGAVVRGSEFEHGGVYFSQLEFPEGVHIAKIAVGHLLIMFASTSGQCYYLDIHDRAQAMPNGFIPLLLEPLTGHYVENMFVFNEFVIILSDGGKRSGPEVLPCTGEVCVMWLSRSCIERRRLVVPYQKTLLFLKFFNNKCVEHVTQVNRLLYFATSNGSVYYLNIDTIELEPQRIPFFDTNPIAIEDHALGIRSALSIINYED